MANKKIEKAELIVSRRLAKIKFQHLRHVIVLTGLNNDGKTSALKALIEELYRLDPKSWRSPRKYDPARVVISAETCKVEYQSVFEYKGIRISIATAGDTSNIIAWNFEYCAKHQVEIGIMAVRVSDGQKKIAAAEYAYKKARSMVSVKEHVVDITGKRIRDNERPKVVKKIIAILDAIAQSKT